MKIEAILLDDSVQAPLVPYKGKNWDLIHVIRIRPTQSLRSISDPTSDATAILGEDPRKWRRVKEGLLLGKNVLVDTPVASDIRHLLELHSLAIKRKLRIESVNLICAEHSVQYLKEFISKHTLLSMTISSSVLPVSNEFHLMKLAQIIDASEWLAGSSCERAAGETAVPKLNACVTLLVMRNGVKLLINTYRKLGGSRDLQIDAIFEDAIATINPYAQSVTVSHFGGTVSHLGWRPTQLPSLLDEFSKRTSMGSPSNLRKQRRIIELARMAFN